MAGKQPTFDSEFRDTPKLRTFQCAFSKPICTSRVCSNGGRPTPPTGIKTGPRPPSHPRPGSSQATNSPSVGSQQQQQQYSSPQQQQQQHQYSSSPQQYPSPQQQQQQQQQQMSPLQLTKKKPQPPTSPRLRPRPPVGVGFLCVTSFVLKCALLQC